MRLGFLGGFLTGAVLSGLVLGTISVVAPIPRVVAPEAGGVDVPAGSEFRQSREDREAELPVVGDSPEADAAPRVEAPDPDDLTRLRQADTDPAAQPETGSAGDPLTAPEMQGDETGIEVGGDEPVLPSPQALAPEAPEGEAGLSISTDPAQPMQPPVEEDSGLFSAPGAGPEDRSEDTAQAVVPEPEGEAPAPQAVGEDARAPAGEENATGTLPRPEEQAPAAESDTASETPEATVPSEAPEPSGTIGDLAGEVTTGRLPSVTDDAQDAGDGRPPLERFAASYENPEGKPLMAVVLIDDGSSPIGHAALADFPYPVSYAVDAGWPGAREAAAKYREAGLEVLVMADLPENASARDAEVAMETYLAAVPGAVAVMEGTGSGLQASRDAAEQLIPILKDSGHGLVLFSTGLDTARKLIAREGVPVAPVFRDVDAQGQDARVIRRFLDRAAFKAGQEEAGVILVGRLRAETVSALLLWGLQDRAGSVALAPVSAVLRAFQQ